MISLIHPDGTPDEAAIQAEIARRTGDHWNRAYHERHVAQEVAAQQWPLVEKEIAREWSPGERRAYDEAMTAASRQAIDGAGNDRYDALVQRARIIRETVQARAIIAFHRRIGS